MTYVPRSKRPKPPGPLRDRRHERFAQKIAAGMPASQAYKAAGFASQNKGAASHLRHTPHVSLRIAEILNDLDFGTPEVDPHADLPRFERETWALHDACKRAGDRAGMRRALELLKPPRARGKGAKTLQAEAEAATDADAAKPRQIDPDERARIDKMLDVLQIDPAASGGVRLATAEDRAAEAIERAEDARRADHTASWIDANMALYRQRCAAWQAANDTPEQRLAILESKRQPVG